MQTQCIRYNNQFPFVNYLKHKALTNGGNLSCLVIIIIILDPIHFYLFV
jgi:hypothetical protein